MEAAPTSRVSSCCQVSFLRGSLAITAPWAIAL